MRYCSAENKRIKKRKKKKEKHIQLQTIRKSLEHLNVSFEI